MEKIKRAVKHFISEVVEEGPEDTAAWEHMGHIESALAAKSETEAVAILEDAVGPINWSAFIVEYETVCAECGGDIKGVGPADDYLDVCEQCGLTEGPTVKKEIE